MIIDQRLTDGAMTEIYVVETSDGEVHLGALAVAAGRLVVLSGYVGRPPLVELEDVVSIVLADDHPDVEPA